jgi:aryl-alcohol dehydrogenase-like predicted oxidoreductase
MKIALGTAQWGMEYGISNTRGIPSDQELTKIFNCASQANIDTFDTAAAYGNAEKRIGDIGSNSVNVITKISAISSESIVNQVKQSLQNLKCNSVYGCLFHNAKDLLKSKKKWDELFNLKQNGLVKKIGYSLYDVDDLEDLLSAGINPDIVQVPYSLLDRKFEPYFIDLKQNKIEIHTRSVFLQGLYFKLLNEIPLNLTPLKIPLKKLQIICKKESVSMLELCLAMTLQNRMIDYAVIGVETLVQLEEIIEATKVKINSKVIEEVESIIFNQKELLNPVNWK